MSTTYRIMIAGAVLACGAATASAQGLNIDIGPTTFGAPSAAFGAASGQAGVWNDLTTAAAQSGVAPIVDLGGVLTGVTLTATPAATFTIADFSFDNTATPSGSDEEKLLDDLCDSSTSTWVFAGLANQQYDVYVYAWAPDARTTFFSDVTVVGGSAGTVHCGGANWTGTFVTPAIYMKDTVLVTGGTLTINMANPVPVTPTSINGFQLVPTGCAAPVVYCTAKANSQNGVLPGCPNGILAIGSTGVSSATATSGFTISAVNSLNNKIGIMIYKNSVAGSAMGAQPFAGGTLCLASGLGPNRTTPVNSGGTPAPANDCSGIYAIDMNTFARGLIPGPPLPQAYLNIQGQEVVAQFWGRDPGFAPPNNVQLSDALRWTICQ